VAEEQVMGARPTQCRLVAESEVDACPLSCQLSGVELTPSAHAEFFGV